MRGRTIELRILALSVFLVVFPGEAQDGTDDPSAELKAQIEGLLRLAEDRSEFGMKQLMVAVSPMVLPDSMAWFSETFGPEKGKLLDEEYRAMTRDLDGLAVRGVSGFGVIYSVRNFTHI